ncbi:hypothetical protein HZ326_31554 [Fusarium oxysporum f. sp. albedinis]|nr:hypothetical protein HZ326_31554 [Fusarium oxysporum f. sp. albedinis]
MISTRVLWQMLKMLVSTGNEPHYKRWIIVITHAPKAQEMEKTHRKAGRPQRSGVLFHTYLQTSNTYWDAFVHLCTSVNKSSLRH